MTHPTAPTAVRLVFAYQGDEVRLVHQQTVDLAVPGMNLPREERAGTFVEVRASDGRRLSQIPVRGAMTGRREIFPDNPDDPITTVEVPDESGAFTVVVPVSDRADHVTVVRRETGATEQDTVSALAMTELASFALAPSTEDDE